MQFNIGVDIGGAAARMTVKGRGMVLRQSSAAAFRRGAMIAQGNDALSMLGRAPGDVEIVFPMAGGQIAREDALSGWLKYMLRQAGQSGLVSRPRVLVSRPCEMPLSQMRRLVALVMDAGANTCSVLREDLCAAIGAKVPVLAPGAHLILDLGATHMSATLISFGRAVDCQTLPYGLKKADESIRRMLLLEEGLKIGPRAAEALRVSLASALRVDDELTDQAAGLLLETGFPALRPVKAERVRAAVAPLIDDLLTLAETVILRAPDELAADLTDAGVTLTGGGAQLFGLDKRVAERLNLTAFVPEDAQACAIRGLERALEGGEGIEQMTEGHQSILDRRGR